MTSVAPATATAKPKERSSAPQMSPINCCSTNKLSNQCSETPRNGNVNPPRSPWKERMNTEIMGE